MNRALFWPFVLPYVAYVAIAYVPTDVLARPWNYGLRILVCGALLVWGRSRYGSLRGPRNLWGSLAVGGVVGLAGTGLWVLLAGALTDPYAGDAWTPAAFWMRAAASVLVVPLFEELLMRGYVLRFAVQWGVARRAGADDPFGVALDGDVRDVSPGALSLFALAVSSAAFAVGHMPFEMPAALVYGALMAGLWRLRGDLASCVAAHAATNLTLALHIRATGAWGFW